MGTSTIELAEQCARRKPDGGFRFVGLEQLAALWTAYQSGQLQARDTRVYFALHEIVERRCRKREGRAAFSFEELHRLVGGDPGAKLRACVRRLERANLIRWSEQDIRFATKIEHARLKEPERAEQMLAQMPKLVRIPMPRRMLRQIAESGKRVELATVLGIAVRSLRWKKGTVWPAGCASARWIAETFGVAESRVRAERQRLIQIGWLEPADAGWSHRQRFGARFVVNLSWRRAGEGASKKPQPMPKTEPLERRNRPELRGPCLTQNSSFGGVFLNTKPAGRGPAGVLRSDSQKPQLRKILLEDLRQTDRLLELFRQAVGQGLWRESEHERLEFVSLAEYAKAHGDDPPALFTWLLKRGARDRITQASEDDARMRLRLWDHPEPEEDRGGGGRSHEIVRSDAESASGSRRQLEGPIGGFGSRKPTNASQGRSEIARRQAVERAEIEQSRARAPKRGTPEAALYWAQKNLELQRQRDGWRE